MFTPTDRFCFFAHGVPAPKGSMNAYVRGGRAVLVHSQGERLKTWRSLVREQILAATHGADLTGRYRIVSVEMVFALPRPKTRPAPYAGVLTPKQFAIRSTYTPHVVKPDVDKLARTVLDELTHCRVVTDDSRVYELRATKEYAPPGEPPGLWCAVRNETGALEC